MNEIITIHLGRQPFVIAVDAHQALKAYLGDIEEQVGDNPEVVKEIELRIAELLVGRGITDKKVVILADIAYVKEQLGEPAEFRDDEKPGVHAHKKPHRGKDEDGTPRRLYRDTDNAIVGGVCAGLAAFFGIDAIVVRLIFVAFTLLGGSGILIYLLLWALVPAAHSESDRLQMQGKPVTVENIKEAVANADVQGAANRVARGLERLFIGAGKLFLALIGVGFSIAGIGLMLGGATFASLVIVHGARLGTDVVFPVGGKQVLAVCSVLAVVLILGVLSVLAGRAMIRRRWGVPGWVLASLVAIFIAGGSIGAATIVDSIDPVRDRIHSVSHQRWVQVGDFSKVEFLPGDVTFGIARDGQVGVEIRSFGTVDTRPITAQVKDGVLTIDARTLRDAKQCMLLCPYGPTNVEVRVHVQPNSDVQIVGEPGVMASWR